MAKSKVNKAKIVWFNQLKGFGEATLDDGRNVYINALSFSGLKRTLRAEDEIEVSKLTMDKDAGLVAFSAKLLSI